MTLRALITNDDGIESEGLRQLARMVRDAGLEVVVAAPRDESSGSSASLTAVQADGRVLVEERMLGHELAGVPAYAVAATPGFIALIASRGAFGRCPDVVLSGINRGANTGHAILHSGTVGASLTARLQGCRALAVSLDASAPNNWETAAEVARDALGHLLASDAPLVLNVNVPDLPVRALRGLRRARLSSFGAVQTTITEVAHGYVRVAVADLDAEREPGTDATMLAAGFATVTALEPICERHAELPGIPHAGRGDVSDPADAPTTTA
ncbi:MAG: 5'/3'-nucleotidase SurE [Chloroflexi bacterium]|nr:MAG: 5'/3'-nucleotidase SurE [Chloroflexota bacterium]